MHVPVLLNEVITLLDPQPGENFVDATFGAGGHAREILKHLAPEGRLLALDWDSEAIKGSGLETRSGDLEESEPLSRSGIEPGPLKNLVLVHGNFADIAEIGVKSNFNQVDGVLFDLGLSSDQLEEKGERGETGGRGFSYLRDESLDMRFDRGSTSLTAAEIVNEWPEKELERIFREYGEEKQARKIARAIAAARQDKKIERTAELTEVIDKAVASNAIKTYSRIFQALRIAVNNELENIGLGLEGAWKILRPGGRLAVISFHSLEDRIVKNFFNHGKKEGVGEIITQKPIRPSAEEITANPRARSAKLRGIQKYPMSNY